MPCLGESVERNLYWDFMEGDLRNKFFWLRCREVEQGSESQRCHKDKLATKHDVQTHLSLRHPSVCFAETSIPTLCCWIFFRRFCCWLMRVLITRWKLWNSSTFVTSMAFRRSSVFSHISTCFETKRNCARKRKPWKTDFGRRFIR